MATMCGAGLHDLDAPGGRHPVGKYRAGVRIGTTTICRVCYMASTQRRKRARRARNRDVFLKMYGGACACCGIDRPVFLALDHVQNNGYLDRRGGNLERTQKRNNSPVYARAVAEYRPDLYQILCHNCNYAKHAEDNHTCREETQ